MASILSILPPEMLDRIFSFLSEDKQAIGASRLVSHSFKHLSSPYLITRVVFARRLKAIAHLNEIVEHSYFHKYVTELIYDASSYNRGYALDWTYYVRACLTAPQEFKDAEWARRKLEDQTVWRNIEASTGTVPDSASISAGLADSDQRGDRSTDSLHDELGEEISNEDYSEDEDDDESESSGSSSEHEGGDLGFYDQAYTLGCHQTFPDYHRLYLAERQIERKGVQDQILRKAFSRLKRLKSVVLTDWRGLARRDESYDDCAHRLFGNTLAPDLTMKNTVGLSFLFEQLMETINSQDACIEYFSTGSHIFQDEACDIKTIDPRAPICISACAIDRMIIVIGKLRQLHLQVDIYPNFSERTPEDSDFKVRHTLGQASNLEHLTLAIRLPKGRTYILHDFDVGIAVYQSWLVDQHFSHLKTMDLRGWILPEVGLKAFLARHAPTLRTLHFINCQLVGYQVPLAEWAGKDLKLDGIEIGLASRKGAFCLQGRSDGTPEKMAVKTALVPQYEPVWLAGRRNYVTRRLLTGHLRNDRLPDSTPWWKKKGREEI